MRRGDRLLGPGRGWIHPTPPLTGRVIRSPPVRFAMGRNFGIGARDYGAKGGPAYERRRGQPRPPGAGEIPATPPVSSPYGDRVVGQSPLWADISTRRPGRLRMGRGLRGHAFGLFLEKGALFFPQDAREARSGSRDPPYRQREAQSAVAATPRFLTCAQWPTPSSPESGQMRLNSRTRTPRVRCQIQLQIAR